MLAPQTSVLAAGANTTLNLGMVLEPPHLDPTAGAAAAIDEVTYANVFEGLTRIGPDGSVRPALAKSWEVSEDGKVYTFHLQENVSFHDGTPFTAEDVKFSLGRARAEDSVNAQKQRFHAIDSVEVIDPLTVKVSLNRPAGDLLFNLGWGDAVMVSPETSAKNKTNPIGTGPFKFESWTKGQDVKLVRNEAYWGEPVALESATMKFISDPSSAFAAMMSGDVDAFANYPAPETMAQFEMDPRFKVVIGSTEGETILSTNNKKGPFKDVRVRRAIAHAIDRQSLIEGAMFGLGTPIGTHFAPHHPAYVDLTTTYPLDLEKAKALLAEAGYPEGFKATLQLPPPQYARRGGELIASDLKKVGIELEIIPVEWAQWLSKVYKERDYDLTIVSHTEPMDIGIYARNGYYFNYDSEAFKQIMKDLDATTDTSARYELLRKAQEQITADAVNGYLFQLAKAGVWNANLEGLWENSPIPANDLTQVHWKN
ncbi:ABC transporter substrate-binding protein [Flexibacterium corallicola]|uniref:ABC transporter substrate-binding protein n=1 Tax=Flexibacterium corallicola TaxID=3037259 RepID=UPI00286FA404|nr:ABC transporter substrate-binding protein [Pseudovibrio sp. M1P-2-3]